MHKHFRLINNSYTAFKYRFLYPNPNPPTLPCSNIIKWWVTDIDSSRAVAVTPWIRSVCYLPFTCCGEYGSELESGGDSGSVLKEKQKAVDFISTNTIMSDFQK